MDERIIQMAEAHLLNIQNELQKLEANRNELESQISQIKNYLTDAVEAVNIARQEKTSDPTNTTMEP
jgi:predicted  nucleic acid-binding Zn-ribbon protein